MAQALNLIRSALHYRRDAFDAGLRACGFDMVTTLPKPRAGDVLVIWNRYAGFGEIADHFERRGASVLVAENNPLGNDMHGRSYSLALRHVAITGGEIVEGACDRWDSWGINAQPWRTSGREVVVLGQRGIGHQNVRSPDGWAERAAKKTGGRIRQHPGQGQAMALADDLRDARAVITWSSAAALQALLLGVPVWHEHPLFIGARASRPLSEWGGEPNRDDAARRAVFRRLAWAIWALDEIRTGVPILRALAGGGGGGK